MNVIIQYLYKIYQNITRKEVSILPSYISFYMLLSFVPLLSLILIVLSLIYKNDHEFLLLLAHIFPENSFQLFNQFIQHYSVNIKILTINNLMLIYLTSRIYFSIYHANTVIYKSKVKRNFIIDKSLAILNTVLILLMIIVLAIVVILGKYANEFLIDYFGFTNNINNVVRIIIIFVSINLITSVIMLSLPKNKYNIKKVLKGSTTSAILIMLSTYVFKVYVEVYSNFDDIYYTFSTIIIFILWVYLLSYSILIGLTVNYIQDLNKN